jgi:hypothetical protein
MDNQHFTIESLGISYEVQKTENEQKIVLSESDFEKLFSQLDQYQQQIEDLQAQLIEELKKQALIKNILSIPS